MCQLSGCFERSAARGALNKPYARKAIDTADRSTGSGKRLGIRDLMRGVAYPFSNPFDLLISVVFLSSCVAGLTLFLDGSVLEGLASLVCAVILMAFSFDRLSLIHASIRNGSRLYWFGSRRRSTDEGGLLRCSGWAFAAYASSFGNIYRAVVCR